MKMLKMCLEPRVLMGLAAVGIGVYALAPGVFTAVLPLLIIAVCPLSMVVMMVMMGRGSGEAKRPRDDGPADEADVRAELAQLHVRQEDLRARLASQRREATRP